MKIRLSEHFTYQKLLRFVLPSIIMMIFTSIYGVVDGLFVSNYVGKTAFAGLNLIMPFIMALSALGFMMGTGGSAIVAKTLGEGKKKKANEYFSLIVYVTLVGGILFAIIGILLTKQVSIALGATGELLDNCILYGRIIFLSMPAFMLQNVFQCFFCDRRKTQIRIDRYSACRGDQYDPRFFVYCGIWLGPCRGGFCDGMRGMCRWIAATGIFWKEKCRPVPAGKDKIILEYSW